MSELRICPACKRTPLYGLHVICDHCKTLTKAQPKKVSKGRHLRLALKQKGWRCYYCQSKLLPELIGTKRGSLSKEHRQGIPTIDHLHPKSRGGRDGFYNEVLCCDWCNSQKGSLTVEEFRILQGSPTKRIGFLRLSLYWLTQSLIKKKRLEATSHDDRQRLDID